MTFSQKLGLNLTPLVLRFAIGLVFIWASVPKLFYTMPVEGDAAARLIELGVISAPAGSAPTITPPAEDETNGPAPEASANAAFVVLQAQAEPPADGSSQEASSSADVPGEELRVQRLNGLVLLLDSLAQSGHWPSFLATPRMLVILAWAAALTEFIGGICLIFGLFTRLWGLNFFVVMCVAMWTTQIAPAITGTHPMIVAGQHEAIFGFLPPLRYGDPNPGLWVQAWTTILFQLVTMAGGLALLFSGSGCLSVDRFVFSKPKKHQKTAHEDDAYEE